MSNYEQLRVEARGSRPDAINATSNDAIISKNLDGTVTSWNEAAETMFGYTADEIIGHSILCIIPLNRIEEESWIIGQIKSGQKILRFPTERRCKDGNIVHVTLTISPIFDDGNNLVGISKIARDLTETENFNRDLERREALFRAILEASPEALVVIDECGMIQSFGVAAERMFGLTASEAIGSNVSILMPSPYRTEHDDYIARYLLSGERHIIGIGRVIVAQRKDGNIFPIELTIGEVNIPGQRLFAGFIRDLTEKQTNERRINELQAELVHVSRVAELGQMVSALAHEVNQPLTAMASYLGGIKRLLTTGNIETVQNALEHVFQQGNRAQQIIQRIRDHVSKRHSEKRAENLSAVIEEAVALAMVGTSGVKLQINLAEAANAAFIDKVEIQQVLINLIRNATEAMASMDRRELSVSSMLEGDMVKVAVADTGSGLSPEVKEKLFQPFVTTKETGMGVGLSVCKTIIETHGGKMNAEERVGGGSIFHFTVPYAQPVLSEVKA